MSECIDKTIAVVTGRIGRLQDALRVLHELKNWNPLEGEGEKLESPDVVSYKGVKERKGWRSMGTLSVVNGAKAVVPVVKGNGPVVDAGLLRPGRAHSVPKVAHANTKRIPRVLPGRSASEFEGRVSKMVSPFSVRGMAEACGVDNKKAHNVIRIWGQKGWVRQVGRAEYERTEAWAGADKAEVVKEAGAPSKAMERWEVNKKIDGACAVRDLHLSHGRSVLAQAEQVRINQLQAQLEKLEG